MRPTAATYNFHHHQQPYYDCRIRHVSGLVPTGFPTTWPSTNNCVDQPANTTIHEMQRAASVTTNPASTNPASRNTPSADTPEQHQQATNQQVSTLSTRLAIDDDDRSTALGAAHDGRYSRHDERQVPASLTKGGFAAAMSRELRVPIGRPLRGIAANPRWRDGHCAAGGPPD